MLALLAEAQRQAGSGALTAGCSSFPRFDRLIGVEKRPRIARLARKALGPDAEILEQDARSIATGSYSVVLFFDVLHLMSPDDQEAIGIIALGLSHVPLLPSYPASGLGGEAKDCRASGWT